MLQWLCCSSCHNNCHAAMTAQCNDYAAAIVLLQWLSCCHGWRVAVMIRHADMWSC